MDRLHQGSLVGERRTRVGDDYWIRKRIGKGTYSEVFEAKHKVSSMERCIKVTHKKNLENTSNGTIFEEIKILSEIDHPNIMRVFEYYQDQNYIYTVAEYLTGGELFDWIQHYKRFDEVSAAHFMKQILSAVSYLHKHKIIHRDLKPENIVFEAKDPNSNLKIIDFGTSKRLLENQKLNSRLGTAYYMAPEVLKNSYDFKCDIWSCGVILYIFLCGYPPFNGKNNTEIFERILQGAYCFPVEDWSYVSQEAKDLVTKMLTYEPSKRPTADDLLKHPWFNLVKQQTFSQEINNAVLKNFREFNNKYKLQKAVLIYFVSFFDIRQEKANLLNIFRELDKDGDGQISREELKVAYQKSSLQSLINTDTNSILDKLDFNKTDAIDFSEFLVANVNFLQSLNRQRLIDIFKLIDQDRNGTLSITEIKDFLNLGGAEHEDFVKTIIAEVDKNKDGVISFDEFLLMMDEFLKRSQ